MKTVLSLLVILMICCSEKVAAPDQAPPAGPPGPAGMKAIASSGKTFIMGSFDVKSKENEHPAMGCSFTYSFWMDSTEVTIGDYRRVRGRIPSEYGSKVSVDDREPVCYVTWYDAALYCNARSKLAGLDTVYDYERADTNASGRATRLVGLTFRQSKPGIRLPTEAEWEFAARAGSSDPFVWGTAADNNLAAKYAWYASSSQGHAHAVAQLKPNGSGLYDVCGNALEWTNDWLGPFRIDGVVDFLGGLETPSGERAVKGGGYSHPLSDLRPANRSDVYTTTSSTTAAYLGFRCAFGAIQNGSYLSASGTVGAPSPVRVLDVAVPEVFSSAGARIVFVNRSSPASRTLCYVDYSEAKPLVHQFNDMLTVYVPTTSPDGEWVAFCTNGEGQSGGSSVYVRRLDPSGSGLVELGDRPAFVPRWWVDAGSSDTFIVYTTSAISDIDPTWPASQTKMQRMSGGKPSGAPVVLEPHGSFHGGLSADMMELATGYTLLRVKPLRSTELRTLFVGPANGKEPGDTSQVCNVSSAPGALSDLGRVLFLDFGYWGTSKLTGCSYDVHQYLFTCDYTGGVRKWYGCPQARASWDHPEWSNRYDYAVAGIKNRASSHEALYVVNLRDSVFTRVIEGTDLWHPYLWISSQKPVSAVGLSLDSLGAYNEPPAGSPQDDYAGKMAAFWVLHDSLDVVCVGSSRVLHGIDANALRPYSALNMGISGGDLLYEKNAILGYILIHCPKVKAVVMSLGLDWLAKPNGSNIWLQAMEHTRGFNYDRNHGFWADGLPAGFVDRVRTVAGSGLQNVLNNGGLVALASAGWGQDSTVSLEKDWGVDDSEYVRNFATLGGLAQSAAARRVHLVVVAFPQWPAYCRAGFYGRYGPKLSTARSVVEQVRALEAQNPYFHLYDAHRFGNHDFVDVDAYNMDHLSAAGARKLTSRVDSLLHVYLGP